MVRLPVQRSVCLTLVVGKTHKSDVSMEGVQIWEHVDTNIGERIHTSTVIGCLIDMVHANSIGAELLHEGGISLTLLSVD